MDEEYWQDQAETLRNKVELLKEVLAQYACEKNWRESNDHYRDRDLWAGPIDQQEINEHENLTNNGFYLAQKVLWEIE